MNKPSCPPGMKWDRLVRICISNRMEPLTAPPLVLHASNTPHNSVLVPGLVLWSVVVLAIVGSILALALWFIIFRRQSRLSSPAGDAESAPESPATVLLPQPQRNGWTEMFHLVPSPCPHLYLGTQTGLTWEEGLPLCGAPLKPSGTEVGGALSACSTVTEHRIPLPATELGGTALVTTKTV
uniref:tumor necrosis factor receptor superfamily member 13C-like n=1 Tax=Monopterus albus TaxID=43700 RepID=UPI0009B4CFD8|nr:tumor necrosis factor receptor superfamily member 13C-like [Monopterus albus]XP_020443487.1 tumor necrosis factor receptor superfamily member 13C-like [Monopterus albus]XP_020443488.1 tumor necrosis factor receptor superfamily member 13C-like [Monopterus albus]